MENLLSLIKTAAIGSDIESAGHVDIPPHSYHIVKPLFEHKNEFIEFLHTILEGKQSGNFFIKKNELSHHFNHDEGKINKVIALLMMCKKSAINVFHVEVSENTSIRGTIDMLEYIEYIKSAEVATNADATTEDETTGVKVETSAATGVKVETTAPETTTTEVKVETTAPEKIDETPTTTEVKVETTAPETTTTEVKVEAAPEKKKK